MPTKKKITRDFTDTDSHVGNLGYRAVQQRGTFATLQKLYACNDMEAKRRKERKLEGQERDEK